VERLGLRNHQLVAENQRLREQRDALYQDFRRSQEAPRLEDTSTMFTRSFPLIKTIENR